jgi:hypothetical protein
VNRAIAILLALLPAAALAQPAALPPKIHVVNVTPSFQTGVYSTIAVNPADPLVFAVGTSDGHVLHTVDGARTVVEALVNPMRIYGIMTLRGQPTIRPAIGRVMRPPGAMRLFITTLRAGLTATRWAVWMSMDDPPSDIIDIAIPAEGKLAAVSPFGVFVSDVHRESWLRTLGEHHPRLPKVSQTAVAVSPGDPSLMLAGSTAGLWISRNGGESWTRHPDKTLAEEFIGRILWDPGLPDLVFVASGGVVYQSEDGGATFAAALQVDGDILSMALTEEGMVLGTTAGAVFATGEGNQVSLASEVVLGVVNLGGGAFLAATELGLFLVPPGQKPIALHRTTSLDPFVGLGGNDQLAWAATRHEIFRIGPAEDTSPNRRPPVIGVTLTTMEQSAMRRLGIMDPKDTRLGQRWWSYVLPRVVLEVRGNHDRDFMISRDGTFPTLDYRFARESGEDGVEWTLTAHFDLSHLVFQKDSLSNPFGFQESNLRNMRDSLLAEVRWRYREARMLADALKNRPNDEQVRLLWELRLEEHAAYLEAMTGQKLLEDAEESP